MLDYDELSSPLGRITAMVVSHFLQAYWSKNQINIKIRLMVQKNEDRVASLAVGFKHTNTRLGASDLDLTLPLV